MFVALFQRRFAPWRGCRSPVWPFQMQGPMSAILRHVLRWRKQDCNCACWNAIDCRSFCSHAVEKILTFEGAPFALPSQNRTNPQTWLGLPIVHSSLVACLREGESWCARPTVRPCRKFSFHSGDGLRHRCKRKEWCFLVCGCDSADL